MDMINLLIKPASGLCNMECSYCFYKDELTHSVGINPEIMNETVMEQLIQKVCEETRRKIRISFQGGEPTLAGIDFFRRFISLTGKYKAPRCEVEYAIQTNGLLINEEWVEFLHQNRFLVGLSFDGTPQLHDGNRPDRSRQGTAGRVEAAWRMLRDYQVETNLLCVVTRQAARKPERIYRYLKQMGGRYLQFIPCISPVEASCRDAPWALTPALYGHFMKAVFDLWYQDWKNGDYVSIRQFDDYINLMCKRPTSSCASCGKCGGYFVVECDGSVYPCDFYVADEWKLGNIRDDTFTAIRNGRRTVEFAEKSDLPEACAACRYYGLCRGGCKNDRRREDDGVKNIYCKAYQEFFAYAGARLQEIAWREMQMCAGDFIK